MMKHSEYIRIEESILKITNMLLEKWDVKFNAISITRDIPVVSRYDSDTNYFSEIEVNFWHKEGTFAAVFSIIIFMQNNQILDIAEARCFIENEIEVCYNECLPE